MADSDFFVSFGSNSQQFVDAIEKQFQRVPGIVDDLVADIRKLDLSKDLNLSIGLTGFQKDVDKLSGQINRLRSTIREMQGYKGQADKIEKGITQGSKSSTDALNAYAQAMQSADKVMRAMSKQNFASNLEAVVTSMQAYKTEVTGLAKVLKSEAAAIGTEVGAMKGHLGQLVTALNDANNAMSHVRPSGGTGGPAAPAGAVQLDVGQFFHQLQQTLARANIQATGPVTVAPGTPSGHSTRLPGPPVVQPTEALNELRVSADRAGAEVAGLANEVKDLANAARAGTQQAQQFASQTAPARLPGEKGYLAIRQQQGEEVHRLPIGVEQARKYVPRAPGLYVAEPTENEALAGKEVMQVRVTAQALQRRAGEAEKTLGEIAKNQDHLQDLIDHTLETMVRAGASKIQLNEAEAAARQMGYMTGARHAQNLGVTPGTGSGSVTQMRGRPIHNLVAGAVTPEQYELLQASGISKEQLAQLRASSEGKRTLAAALRADQLVAPGEEGLEASPQKLSGAIRAANNALSKALEAQDAGDTKAYEAQMEKARDKFRLAAALRAALYGGVRPEVGETPLTALQRRYLSELQSSGRKPTATSLGVGAGDRDRTAQELTKLGLISRGRITDAGLGRIMQTPSEFMARVGHAPASGSEATLPKSYVATREGQEVQRRIAELAVGVPRTSKQLAADLAQAEKLEQEALKNDQEIARIIEDAQPTLPGARAPLFADTSGTVMDRAREFASVSEARVSGLLSRLMTSRADLTGGDATRPITENQQFRSALAHRDDAITEMVGKRSDAWKQSVRRLITTMATHEKGLQAGLVELATSDAKEAGDAIALLGQLVPSAGRMASEIRTAYQSELRARGQYTQGEFGPRERQAGDLKRQFAAAFGRGGVPSLLGATGRNAPSSVRTGDFTREWSDLLKGSLSSLASVDTRSTADLANRTKYDQLSLAEQVTADVILTLRNLGEKDIIQVAEESQVRTRAREEAREHARAAAARSGARRETYAGRNAQGKLVTPARGETNAEFRTRIELAGGTVGLGLAATVDREARQAEQARAEAEKYFAEYAQVVDTRNRINQIAYLIGDAQKASATTEGGALRQVVTPQERQTLQRAGADYQEVAEILGRMRTKEEQASALALAQTQATRAKRLDTSTAEERKRWIADLKARLEAARTRPERGEDIRRATGKTSLATRDPLVEGLQNEIDYVLQADKLDQAQRHRLVQEAQKAVEELAKKYGTDSPETLRRSARALTGNARQRYEANAENYAAASAALSRLDVAAPVSFEDALERARATVIDESKPQELAQQLNSVRRAAEEAFDTRGAARALRERPQQLGLTDLRSREALEHLIRMQGNVGKKRRQLEAVLSMTDADVRGTGGIGEEGGLLGEDRNAIFRRLGIEESELTKAARELLSARRRNLTQGTSSGGSPQQAAAYQKKLIEAQAQLKSLRKQEAGLSILDDPLAGDNLEVLNRRIARIVEARSKKASGQRDELLTTGAAAMLRFMGSGVDIEAGLQAYMAAMNGIPPALREREQTLAKQLQEHATAITASQYQLRLPVGARTGLHRPEPGNLTKRLGTSDEALNDDIAKQQEVKARLEKELDAVRDSIAKTIGSDTATYKAVAELLAERAEVPGQFGRTVTAQATEVEQALDLVRGMRSRFLRSQPMRQEVDRRTRNAELLSAGLGQIRAPELATTAATTPQDVQRNFEAYRKKLLKLQDNLVASMDLPEGADRGAVDRAAAHINDMIAGTEEAANRISQLLAPSEARVKAAADLAEVEAKLAALDEREARLRARSQTGALSNRARTSIQQERAELTGRAGTIQQVLAHQDQQRVSRVEKALLASAQTDFAIQSLNEAERVKKAAESFDDEFSIQLARLEAQLHEMGVGFSFDESMTASQRVAEMEKLLLNRRGELKAQGQISQQEALAAGRPRRQVMRELREDMLGGQDFKKVTQAWVDTAKVFSEVVNVRVVEIAGNAARQLKVASPDQPGIDRRTGKATESPRLGEIAFERGDIYTRLQFLQQRKQRGFNVDEQMDKLRERSAALQEEAQGLVDLGYLFPTVDRLGRKIKGDISGVKGSKAGRQAAQHALSDNFSIELTALIVSEQELQRELRVLERSPYLTEEVKKRKADVQADLKKVRSGIQKLYAEGYVEHPAGTSLKEAERNQRLLAERDRARLRGGRGGTERHDEDARLIAEASEADRARAYAMFGHTPGGERLAPHVTPVQAAAAAGAQVQASPLVDELVKKRDEMRKQVGQVVSQVSEEEIATLAKAKQQLQSMEDALAEAMTTGGPELEALRPQLEQRIAAMRAGIAAEEQRQAQLQSGGGDEAAKALADTEAQIAQLRSQGLVSSKEAGRGVKTEQGVKVASEEVRELTARHDGIRAAAAKARKDGDKALAKELDGQAKHLADQIAALNKMGFLHPLSAKLRPDDEKITKQASEEVRSLKEQRDQAAARYWAALDRDEQAIAKGHLDKVTALEKQIAALNAQGFLHPDSKKLQPKAAATPPTTTGSRRGTDQQPPTAPRVATGGGGVLHVIVDAFAATAAGQLAELAGKANAAPARAARAAAAAPKKEAATTEAAATAAKTEAVQAKQDNQKSRRARQSMDEANLEMARAAQRRADQITAAKASDDLPEDLKAALSNQAKTLLYGKSRNIGGTVDAARRQIAQLEAIAEGDRSSAQTRDLALARERLAAALRRQAQLATAGAEEVQATTPKGPTKSETRKANDAERDRRRLERARSLNEATAALEAVALSDKVNDTLFNKLHANTRAILQQKRVRAGTTQDLVSAIADLEAITDRSAGDEERLALKRQELAARQRRQAQIAATPGAAPPRVTAESNRAERDAQMLRLAQQARDNAQAIVAEMQAAAMQGGTAQLSRGLRDQLSKTSLTALKTGTMSQPARDKLSELRAVTGALTPRQQREMALLEEQAAAAQFGTQRRQAQQGVADTATQQRLAQTAANVKRLAGLAAQVNQVSATQQLDPNLLASLPQDMQALLTAVGRDFNGTMKNAQKRIGRLAQRIQAGQAVGADTGELEEELASQRLRLATATKAQERRQYARAERQNQQNAEKAQRQVDAFSNLVGGKVANLGPLSAAAQADAQRINAIKDSQQRFDEALKLVEQMVVRDNMNKAAAISAVSAALVPEGMRGRFGQNARLTIATPGPGAGPGASAGAALRQQAAAQTMAQLDAATQQEFANLKKMLASNASDLDKGRALEKAFTAMLRDSFIRGLNGLKGADGRLLLSHLTQTFKDLGELSHRAAADTVGAMRTSGSLSTELNAANAANMSKQIGANIGPIQASLTRGRGFVDASFNTMGMFISRNIGGSVVFGLQNLVQQAFQESLSTQQLQTRIADALDQAKVIETFEQTGTKAGASFSDGVVEGLSALTFGMGGGLVESLTSGFSPQAGNLFTDLQEIAMQTGQTIQDVTKSAAELTGVFSAGQLPGAVRVVSSLVQISQGAYTATEAYRSLAATANAFGMEGPQGLQHVSDVVVQMQNAVGVGVEDTLEAVSRLAPIGKTFGLTFEQLSAMSATVSRFTGQTGQAAGEQLSRILATFNTARGQAAVMQATAGKAFAITSEDFDQGLGVVIPKLIENFDQLDTKAQQLLTTTLGGQRQFTAITALLSNADAVSRAFAAAETSAGATERRIDAIMSNLAGRIQQMRISLQALVDNVMKSGLMGWLAGVLLGFNQLLKVVNSLLSTFNNLGNLIAGLPGIPDWVGQLASLVTKLGMAVVGLKAFTAVMRPVGSQVLGRIYGSAQQAGAELPAFVRTTQATQAGMGVRGGQIYGLDRNVIRERLGGETAVRLATLQQAQGATGFLRTAPVLAPLQYTVGAAKVGFDKLGSALPGTSKAALGAAAALNTLRDSVGRARIGIAERGGTMGGLLGLGSVAGGIGMTLGLSAAIYAVSEIASTMQRNAELAKTFGERYTQTLSEDLRRRLEAGASTRFVRLPDEAPSAGRYAPPQGNLRAMYLDAIQTGRLTTPLTQDSRSGITQAQEAARLANERAPLSSSGVSRLDAVRLEQYGVAASEVSDAISMGQKDFESYKNDLVENVKAAGYSSDQIKGLTRSLDALYKKARERTQTTAKGSVEELLQEQPGYVTSDAGVKAAQEFRDQVTGGWQNAVGNFFSDTLGSVFTGKSGQSMPLLDKANQRYEQAIKDITQSTMSAAESRAAVKAATDDYNAEVAEIYNDVANDAAEQSEVGLRSAIFVSQMKQSVELAIGRGKALTMFSQVTADQVNTAMETARLLAETSVAGSGEALAALATSIGGGARLGMIFTALSARAKDGAQQIVDYNTRLALIQEAQRDAVRRLETEFALNPEDQNVRGQLITAIQSLASAEQQRLNNLVEDANFRAQEAFSTGDYQSGQTDILIALTQVRAKMRTLDKSDPAYRQLAEQEKTLRRSLLQAMFGPEKQRLMDQLATAGPAQQTQIRAQLAALEAKMQSTPMGEDEIQGLVQKNADAITKQLVDQAKSIERAVLTSSTASADQKQEALAALSAITAAEASGELKFREGESLEHLQWRIDHIRLVVAVNIARDAQDAAQAAFDRVRGHSGHHAAEQLLNQAKEDYATALAALEGDRAPLDYNLDQLKDPKEVVARLVEDEVADAQGALKSGAKGQEKADAQRVIGMMTQAEAQGKFARQQGESLEHLAWRVRNFREFVNLKIAEDAQRSALALLVSIGPHKGHAAAQEALDKANEAVNNALAIYQSSTPPSFSGSGSTGIDSPTYSQEDQANSRAAANQAAQQAKSEQEAIDAAWAQYQMSLALQDAITQGQMKINENLRKQAIARKKGRAGLAELYGLMAEEVQLRRDLEKAYMDRANAELELANAIDQAAGRNVDAARRSVVIAQNKLANAIKVYGQGSTEALNAQAEVVNAEAAARDAYLQERLDTIDFQREFNEITGAQAIAELEAILKEKDLTEAQRRDILRRIKGIQGEFEGQFNISDIKMPTVYQVRRFIQAAKQGVEFAASAANEFVDAQVAGVTAADAAATNMVAELGRTFDSSIGTFDVSVQRFADAVNRSGSATASGVTINVNGDASTVQKVLDEYFGQLAATANTTGTAVYR